MPVPSVVVVGHFRSLSVEEDGINLGVFLAVSGRRMVLHDCGAGLGRVSFRGRWSRF